MWYMPAKFVSYCAYGYTTKLFGPSRLSALRTYQEGFVLKNNENQQIFDAYDGSYMPLRNCVFSILTLT